MSGAKHTVMLAVALAAALGGCRGAGDVWRKDTPYLCRRTRGEVTIDDSSHPRQWAHAMVITDFVVPVTNRKAADATEMRMLWDDENLYVRFLARDRDLRGTYTGKTDPIWSEDAVEVFLVPDATRGSYYEFEVNPINGLLALQIADTRRGTLAERADWTHNVRRATRAVGTVNAPGDEDRLFETVLAIPFADLEFAGRKAPAVGDVWRFIGARCNLSAQFAEKRELSACVPLPKVDFHINPHYARMRFAE